jgi:hypothetical protein
VSVQSWKVGLDLQLSHDLCRVFVLSSADPFCVGRLIQRNSCVLRVRALNRWDVLSVVLWVKAKVCPPVRNNREGRQSV